jgi:hypothetical protein
VYAGPVLFTLTALGLIAGMWAASGLVDAFGPFPWIMLVFVTGVNVAIQLITARVSVRKMQKAILQGRGQLLTVRWAPSLAQIFSQHGRSIQYEISYRDGKGDLYQALCQSDLFTGVYFANIQRLATPQA